MMDVVQVIMVVTIKESILLFILEYIALVLTLEKSIFYKFFNQVWITPQIFAHKGI